MASHIPSLAQGRDVLEQRIDVQFLSGSHEWQLEPVRGLQFRDTVEQDAAARTDMANFKLIAGVSKQKAMNLFSGFANSPTLFKLPFTLICDRTFARDSEEALYLDAMDMFIRQQPGPIHTTDIPILKRSLENRLFGAFSRKVGYLWELFERRRLKLWLPSDAPENKEFGDAVLSGLYPKTEAWLDQIYQPPALPVPLPFIVYYFHKELRDAQVNPELGQSERMKRLQMCIQIEYYVLFMATWWNEAYHGGKMYLLNTATIEVLKFSCGSISDIAGKPAQVIIEHMKIASQLPHKWHNWMCYKDNSMESSAFVWSRRGYGGLDPNERSGVRVYCDLHSRKITYTRYGSTIVKRVSAMEQRLSVPDLDEIEGLLGLVRDHEWDAHSSLRVSDLLYHMLSLYRRTHQKMGGVLRDNEAFRRELDCIRRDLEERTMHLHDKEDRLDDALRRLDSRERHIDELRNQVADLQVEAADLRKARDEKLRSSHSRPHRDVRRRLNNPYDHGEYVCEPHYTPPTAAPRSPYHRPPTTAPRSPYCTPSMAEPRSPHFTPSANFPLLQNSSTNPPLLSRSQHSRLISGAASNVNGASGTAAGAATARAPGAARSRAPGSSTPSTDQQKKLAPSAADRH